MSNLILDNTQFLIAGDGQLPVRMAKNAKSNGFKVLAVSLSSDNYKELKKYCDKVVSYGCGQLNSIKKFLQENKAKQLTFIGKVSKMSLLKRPILEPMAISLLKSASKLNDDAIMLMLVAELEKIGVTILDQTIFIKDLIVSKGNFTTLKPDEVQTESINYGFKIAKEIGKIDIGQSVVVKDKMIIAVEAIEGTDKCIVRGCKLARKKNAIVVKVAKPEQDMRFDIPTVGLRTLKIMKKHGANVLALEAGRTIIVEQEKMIDYANRHKMIIVAV